MCLKSSPTQNMNYFLHVELVLLLTPVILVFGLNWRSFFNAEFFKFLLKLKVTLFTGMKLQNFKEDMQKVNDSVGVSKKIVLRNRSPGNSICFFTNTMLEILEICVLWSENEMGNQYMEEFLLYFRINQYFIGDVSECSFFVDITTVPILCNKGVNWAERDNVFAFKVTTSSNTLFISLFVA